jgi:hypothetical protein
MPDNYTPTTGADLSLLDQSYYFSGADVRCYVNGIWLDELTYLQMSPQQQMTPIYNVFQRTPVRFLPGNFLVRGVMGFNFVYANYLEQLASDFSETKGMMVKNQYENDIYIQELKIVFDNHIKPVTPTFIVKDMHVTGGVINPSVDGNPVQYVYQFIAGGLEKTS